MSDPPVPEASAAPAPALAPSPSAALLRGAVDSHVHAAPFIDDATMMLDVFELSQAAGRAGMAAVVLKSYFGSSCPAAYLANRHAGGARVVGGVTLNRSVGGFNADAVRVAAYEGEHDGFRPGRVVWMPERSSLHRAKLLGFDAEMAARHLSPFPGGDVEREPTPEALEVLEVIAQEDLVLATSHLGPEEALAYMVFARELGVTRMVVTHASNTGVAWTLDQKQRAVALGALIEEASISWEPAMALFHYAPVDAMTEVIGAMRTIGPEHYVLATDCGFHVAPAPVDALRVFVALLLGAGFTEAEVRTMVSDNPRRLLRLDEPDPRPRATRDRLGV